MPNQFIVPTSGKRTLYIPARSFRWTELIIQLSSGSRHVLTDYPTLLGAAQSTGFLPLYTSLAALREEFPDVNEIYSFEAESLKEQPMQTLKLYA